MITDFPFSFETLGNFQLESEEQALNLHFLDIPKVCFLINSNGKKLKN
jgi:hypothetical protein